MHDSNHTPNKKRAKWFFTLDTAHVNLVENWKLITPRKNQYPSSICRTMNVTQHNAPKEKAPDAANIEGLGFVPVDAGLGALPLSIAPRNFPNFTPMARQIPDVMVGGIDAHWLNLTATQ